MKIIIEQVKPKATFFNLKQGDVFILFDYPKNLLIKMPQIRTNNKLYNAFDLTLSEAVEIEDYECVVLMDDVTLTAKMKNKKKEE